ncbi:YhgE/Pip domain-containing protein [Methanobrevibacter filiformis]|uniref:ABC-2 family transporter protein n=1 Tax=Methanobrevibacter filiformis TaxID=55758 RepID=A0A162FLW8_9EURY|nr:YhgE/Pip family protein [Methanobrevibacter filiformis]KZX11950.1 ABC-2 family transporter protein [Methanobrevibacter filiformis]
MNFISTNYENGYDNLNNGSYYGLLIIHKNFTKNIESINTTDPTHANVQFLINSKTNPVATKLMSNGGNEIQSQINNKIVSTVNGLIFGSAKNMSDSAIPKINADESKMDEINNDLNRYYSDSQVIYHTAEKVVSYLNKHNQSGEIVKKLNNEVNKINNKINSLNNQRLSFKADVDYFNKYYYPLMVKISQYNTLGVENYFNSPVIIDNSDIHPLNSYGDAIAEFYIPLSIFIGSLVSISMFSLRVKGLKVKPLEEYLGKLLLFEVISILQTTVLTIGLLMIHVQNFNPILLLVSNIFLGLCFTTFIYSLVSSLGDVGKFIAILILVFQIGGSGGMYPIELMPKFFQTIHSILPVSYGVAIIRENITAPIIDVMIHDALLLLIFPIVGVVFALIIKPLLQEKLKKLENIFEETELL